MGEYVFGMPQNRHFQQTIPTNGEGFSPHGHEMTSKPSRPYAPLLYECSLSSVRVVDAVGPEFSLETLEPDPCLARFISDETGLRPHSFNDPRTG